MSSHKLTNPLLSHRNISHMIFCPYWNPIETLFYYSSNPVNYIIANFCTYNDSTAVVSWATNCSDYIMKIGRAQNKSFIEFNMQLEIHEWNSPVRQTLGACSSIDRKLNSASMYHVNNGHSSVRDSRKLSHQRKKRWKYNFCTSVPWLIVKAIFWCIDIDYKDDTVSI